MSMDEELDERRAPGAARLVAGALAVLYAGLTPMHLLVLTGSTRVAMAGLAAASAVTMLVLVLRWRRSPAPRDAVGALAAVPLVNSLVHIGLTGQVEQTTTLILTVVAIGAGVTRRLVAALLVGTGCLAWVALVPFAGATGQTQVGHYGTQLAMAVLLAAVLHEVRRRREEALVRARDDLAAQMRTARAAQAVVASSERRFRSIFADSPVGMALADERGRFAAVNPALCRLLDRPESEIVGSTSAAFTHPEDRAQNRAAGALIDGSQDGTALIEKRYLRPDGEVRWAWLTLTHVDGPQGEAWTLAHVQDTTEHRAAERQLEDSEANLAAVSDVVRRIRTGEDVRGSVLDATLRIAEAASAYLVERDDDGGLVISGSVGADLTGTRIPMDEASASAHVWRTGEPLFIPDAAEHPLVSRAMLDLTSACSLLVQPVVTREGVVAVLAATWTHRVADMSDRSARAVALLADETAVALEHDELLSKYTRLATVDQLTGLPNRRGWDERVPQLMATADRTDRPLVVAMADLDRFKAYNDLLGHVQGDELLISMAAMFRATLRATDVAARWGGEEFVLALTDCTDRHAAAVLSRVRAGVPAGQTVSVGYAVWNGRESASALVARADAALYVAKNSGRDRVVAAPQAGTGQSSVVTSSRPAVAAPGSAS